MQTPTEASKKTAAKQAEDSSKEGDNTLRQQQIPARDSLSKCKELKLSNFLHSNVKQRYPSILSKLSTGSPPEKARDDKATPPQIQLEKVTIPQGLKPSSHTRACDVHELEKRKVTDGSQSKELNYNFNPIRDLASEFCNALESLINSMDRKKQKPRRTNPQVHLSGNFFPLANESPPQICPEIKGQIPECLNGVYIRNGPNPRHLPSGGYHYFDGDGMLHAVTIRDGSAMHCCRYTKTNRFLPENEAGRPLFAKPLGDLTGLIGMARLSLTFLRHMLGLIDLTKGIGVANAGVEFFCGRQLAMSEDDKPYALRINPVTGEMFSFSYDGIKSPYLKYFRVSADGKKGEDIPINLPEPTLMHDFAITERFVVFVDHQIMFRLSEMLKGGFPAFCDEEKVPRVGIMPLYDNNDSRIKWFEMPGCTCFHFLNAWDEEDEVSLIGSSLAPLECVFENPEHLENKLYEFCFNLKTGRCRREQICSANLDMGQINKKFTGRKNKYVYMSTSGPWPRFSGIAKVDVSAPRLAPMKSVPGINTLDPCIVGWRNYGESCYGSEPFFVPRNENGPNSEEDDGYLLSFVHNESTEISELLVMDARSPSLEPVCSIRMPCRVPYGFHGIFLTQNDLSKQHGSLL
eukprot:Gb_33721 [translate_table: standard]